MMTTETHFLFLSTVFFVPIIAESQYECGAHGRFEYCIDDIPGCIIGCHCHPGYYFDTESKICEPNIKLTQNYRRQYLPEPTRVTEAPPVSNAEQQTTSNAVDNKLDEITKDADDLGDWLYNQFFKTIENQVYNKTQGEETPPTRRSGDILLQKPSRRSHRKSKRKKKRSKGLKSKLLRITEDDSLFDSTDSDESTYEDYSYSTSESEDDKSDRSKRRHGHKKIVIMNKAPKLPLPSFIFMPNTDMDTPYYPPIGLPPPPAVPMYPMVPVPPMLPGPLGLPLFPYPGVPHEKDDVPKTTASTSTSIFTTTVVTQETETDLSTPTTEPTQSESPPNLRLKHKKRVKPTGKPNFELMRGNQNKQLMKRLREKLNRKRKLENFIADQYQGLETPMDDKDLARMISKGDSSDGMLQPPDVDFKYLADLIHKADLNKTLKSGDNQKISDLQNDPIGVLPGRRSYYQTNDMNNNLQNNVKKQRSRVGNTNDSFYTNLGKQIASMIRKIDSKEQREVNIKIEGSTSKQHSPVFNENNFGSRSFWERSVRSPLKYVNSFTKEMDYLKKSNEDLFSLENRVELAASTTPKLSLHDLENIISTVQKVKFIKPIRNNKYRKTSDHSNASFKLNLFPEHTVLKAIPSITPKQIQKVIKKDEDINKHNARKQQTDSNTLMLSNFRQLLPDYDETIRRSDTGINLFQNLKPTRKPSGENIPSDSRALPQNHNTSKKSTFKKIPTNKANIKYQFSPVLMNHRKLNYHYQSNNPYLFETALPIQYSRINNDLATYGKVEKPSYFHHEFHHFDYFDK